VEAELRLFTDQPDDAPRRVYTRDMSPLGIGFITHAALPLGCGAKLSLPAPNGGVDVIVCTVIRCREITHGWFDCGAAFKEGAAKSDRRGSAMDN
jgi:hypothetical protein